MVPLQKASVGQRYKRWLKVIAILLGLALCVLIGLPAMYIGLTHWKSESAIATIQQNEITVVSKNAYPNSTLIRADSGVSDASAGDTVFIGLWVTFESSDSFDVIKNWYIQHPAGGRWGTEGNDFPQQGLEKLVVTPSGKTQYKVHYGESMLCEDFILFRCERPSQQIQ